MTETDQNKIKIKIKNIVADINFFLKFYETFFF